MIHLAVGALKPGVFEASNSHLDLRHSYTSSVPSNFSLPLSGKFTPLFVTRFPSPLLLVYVCHSSCLTKPQTVRFYPLSYSGVSSVSTENQRSRLSLTFISKATGEMCIAVPSDCISA